MDGTSGDAVGSERRFCLTLVSETSAERIFEAFGGEWTQARRMTDRDADALRDGLPGHVTVPAVRVGACPGGGFAWEDASHQGRRTEVLRRASQAAGAVVVSLAPDDLPRLRWAENGQFVAAVILNAPDRIHGPGAARLRSILDASGWRERARENDQRRVLAAAVELAAALTGTRIALSELTQPLLGGLVLPVLDDLSRSDAATEAPQLRALLDAVDERTAARALNQQVFRLIDDWELDELPAVTAFTGALRAGTQTPVTDDSPLGVLIRRFVSPVHWHTVTPPDVTPQAAPRQTIAALHALRHAAASPPKDALAEVLRARRTPGAVGPRGSLPDLEADLDHPTVDRAAMQTRADAHRKRATERVAAVTLSRQAEGLPPTFPPGHEGWNWLLPHLPHGLSLTFADGLEPAELLARLTGDLSQATTPQSRWLPPAHERATQEDTPACAGVARTGKWAVAVEPWSSIGAQPDMPARISAGTRALCLRHDASGTVRFCYAEDGVLVTEFDPLFPHQPYGTDPDRFTDWLTAHGLRGPAPQAVPQAAVAPYLLATQGFDITLDEATACRPDLIAPLTWVPPLPPSCGVPRRDTPITTPGGLTWWPRPGDPERPIRQRVRPTR